MVVEKSKQIDCAEVMDISAVAELSSTLREIGDGYTVTFKAKSVERIDTSTLQLLTSFISDASTRDITIEWQDPSETLINSARLLGLVEHLCLADV